jgi:hypothetical protein
VAVLLYIYGLVKDYGNGETSRPNNWSEQPYMMVPIEAPMHFEDQIQDNIYAGSMSNGSVHCRSEHGNELVYGGTSSSAHGNSGNDNRSSSSHAPSGTGTGAMGSGDAKSRFGRFNLRSTGTASVIKRKDDNATQSAKYSSWDLDS